MPARASSKISSGFKKRTEEPSLRNWGVLTLNIEVERGFWEMSTNIVSECSTLKVLYCELAETLLDSFHTALDTHKSCDHEVDSVLLPVIFKATLDSYYIPYHLTQRFMFLIDHIPDQIQRADMGNNISFRNFWALPDTSDITLKIIVNGEVLHEANMNFCDPDAIGQALYILDKPASQTNLTLQ